jgi:putative ABC transport system permease protein
MADHAPSQLRWARRVIALAAPIAPADLRADWRREWHAELESAGPSARGLVRHALGSFADAFWLRQRHVADFHWIDDLRHGWRQMREHAGFAGTAVGILAIGIAATVAMFGVIDQILLRPLPYPEPDRLVTVWEMRAAATDRLDVAPANFLDWRDRATSFHALAAAVPTSANHTGGPEPEVFPAIQVTEGFFEAFGVQPLAGRLFGPDEYTRGRGRVMLIHEGLWRQRFGADPGMVGRALEINGALVTVVGILPAAFEPRLLPSAVQRQVWLPKVIEEWEPRIRTSGYWNVVGRLRPEVPLGAARAELAAISRQLALEHPQTNHDTGALVLRVRDHLVGDISLAVGLLGGAVLLVLLIACVNVANLLLARGMARERELAIRVALGAASGRLVRQLLLESLLVAAAGGLLGLLLAHGALRGIALLGPPSVPWIDTLHIDVRALAFTTAIVVLVALIAGTLPALRGARTGLAAAGRQTSTTGPRQHRLRTVLVVSEVALALVLVSGAGLLLRSFTSLVSADTGFARDRVLALQVFANALHPTPESLAQFFEGSLERLAALPGVESAGAVSAMPFIESNINIEDVYSVVNQPPPAEGDAPRAYLSVATPGYFEVMRVPLLEGRLLEPRDGAHQPRVAVISETLRRRHWPDGTSPVGDRLTFRRSGEPMEAEIVGVVASLKHDAFDRPARPEIFLPLAQVPFGSMTFVVRTAGPPAALAESAKAAIWAVSPRQTINRTATLDELILRTMSPRRFALALLLAFALVALLLSAGGVYGVVSAVTHARRREMGVRLALGASRADIARDVLGRGLLMSGMGVAAGLAGAFGAGRLIERYLYGVGAWDGASFATAAAVMVLAALAACSVPARRAANADPTEVLRSE